MSYHLHIPVQEHADIWYSAHPMEHFQEDGHCCIPQLSFDRERSPFLDYIRDKRDTRCKCLPPRHDIGSKYTQPVPP